MHPALAEHVQKMAKEMAKSTNPASLLSESIQIPPSWQGVPSKAKTRAELKSLQRSEFIPDKSYDIDGDGIVGNQDYVF